MQGNHDRPRIRRIERVINETPTVRTLVFGDAEMCGALPGQFAMVWVPGAGELPMSVRVSQEPGRAAFTVRRHGAASTGLYNMKAGGMIGVRGPYGNSFEIRHGKILLAGGGTGLVPLMRLLGRLDAADDVTILIGARTQDEVFFEAEAARALRGRAGKVAVATEDGSYGTRGLVTELAADVICGGAPDAVYTCGPEMMMERIVREACSRGIFVQASVERMMKCGVGICGSCCMGEDLVCTDGAVFEGNCLISNPEFGRAFRNKAGVLEEYPSGRQGLK